MKNIFYECLIFIYLEKKYFLLVLNIKSDLGSEYKFK